MLIYSDKEVTETLIGLKVQINAIHALLVAHDVGEYLESQLLVKQVHSLSGPSIDILSRQKVEELSCLNLSDCLRHENFEHFLNMVELEVHATRVDD